MSIRATIGIPLFKSVEDVDVCLRSVVHLSKQNELEVICYEDNPDIDYSELRSRYPSFHFYRHDKNKGSGATRNDIISKSTAEWITFIDDDDEFTTIFALELLLMKIGNKVAMVESDYMQWNGEDYIRHTSPRVGVHGRLFNKQFLKEYDIEFSDYLICEDTEFMLKLSIAAKEFGYEIIRIDTPIYQKNRNKKSVTRDMNIWFELTESRKYLTMVELDIFYWLREHGYSRRTIREYAIEHMIAYSIYLKEAEKFVPSEIKNIKEGAYKFYADVYSLYGKDATYTELKEIQSEKFLNLDVDLLRFKEFIRDMPSLMS